MTPGTTAAGTDFLSSDYGRKYKKHSVSIFDSLYVNALQEYSLRQFKIWTIFDFGFDYADKTTDHLPVNRSKWSHSPWIFKLKLENGQSIFVTESNILYLTQFNS